MVVYTGSGKRKNVQRDDFSMDGLAEKGRWEGWMEDTKLTQLGPSVVIKLCKPYFNAGHVLVTDNFYNNVPLFQYLKDQGMYAVGTAKANSTGFPQELKNKKAWEKAAVRGEIRFIRIRDVLCLQWMDRKSVSMYSTMHWGQDFDMALRNTKENGRHQKKPVWRPKCIADYNTYMGGVDLSDQMFMMYSVGSRTRKWWKTLFFHLFDMAVVNAYLLWKHSKPSDLALRMANNYSLLDFRTDLAIQLTELDDADENLEGELDFGVNHLMKFFALSVDVQNKLKGNRVGMLCLREGGGGGITAWYLQKQRRRHIPVTLNKQRKCKVCQTISKAVTGTPCGRKGNVVCVL